MQTFISYYYHMKPIIIDSVNAIEVLDSRGNPTIEVSIALHPVHHDTSE